MENRKALLQRQLQANMIKAVCAKQEGVIFREAWCTQERCIRFTTPLLRALFRPKDMGGKWESGDFAMYEVQNDIDIGHIINLINGSGADLLPNLLQVVYATAAGFMFVMIYYKSGSLLACIAAHGVFNALSVFADEANASGEMRILSAVLLAVIAGSYAVYLAWTMKTNDKGE